MRRNGFTLIELVLVMLLIATVVAMAAPSLRGWSHGRDLFNSAEEFVAMTRLARSYAISESTTYRLNIDTNAAVYWLTKQSGSDFVSIGSDVGRQYTLPLGGKIAVVNAADSSKTSFDFYPTGRADAGTVTFSDDKGNVVPIQSPSATENFAIVR
jgi:type II secretion system protein H